MSEGFGRRVYDEVGEWLRNRFDYDEQYQNVVALVVFTIPAVVLAGGVPAPVPEWTLKTLPAFVLFAVFLHWVLTERRESSERTTSDHPEDRDEGAADQTGLVATNYEQMSQQAQYRDQLLINANYFSVAIIAVLVNVFLRVGVELRPFVAMVGAVTAYAFWLATESYKETRDELNDELRRIESVQPKLSVVTTYDTRERSSVAQRSLSSYLISLQIGASVLWTTVYFLYVFSVGYI